MTVTPIRKHVDVVEATEIAKKFTAQSLFGIVGLLAWIVFKVIEVLVFGASQLFDALYVHVFEPLARAALDLAKQNGITVRE